MFTLTEADIDTAAVGLAGRPRVAGAPGPDIPPDMPGRYGMSTVKRTLEGGKIDHA